LLSSDCTGKYSLDVKKVKIMKINVTLLGKDHNFFDDG